MYKAVLIRKVDATRSGPSHFAEFGFIGWSGAVRGGPGTKGGDQQTRALMLSVEPKLPAFCVS